jgi:hypothetical protein
VVDVTLNGTYILKQLDNLGYFMYNERPDGENVIFDLDFREAE